MSQEYAFMRFKNREAAAEVLAKHLMEYRGRNPLVLGIPRGAMPLAKVLAERLNGELDVVLVHKIGAPGNPEYAIGAVSEAGDVIWGETEESSYRPKEQFERLASAEIRKLKEKRHQYSPFVSPISPKDRCVLLVDDGVATGKTMQAAVQLVRRQHPEEIVVCAPIASREAVEELKKIADRVVVLDCPKGFQSVGSFYLDFPQVTTGEVVRLLSHH